MQHRFRYFGVLTFFLCFFSTLALGEISLRIYASCFPVYSFEMVKYAKELKMPDPMGVISHVHRPGARAKLMGVWIELNSQGLRAPELQPTSSSEKRILVLGGSATLGWGVPYERIFTTQLQNELNERALGTRFQVLNAGVGNYNTFAQLQLLERLIGQVHPDFVILNYFLSDLEPSTKGRTSPLLKYSLLADLIFEKYLSFRAIVGQKDLFSYYRKLYGSENPDWARAQSDIAKMHDELKAIKIPFLAVIAPELRDLSENSPYASIYSEIDEKFRSMNIPALNAFPVFQKRFENDSQEAWVQSDDPHPNAEGHALLAKALLDYFEHHPEFLGVRFK